MLLHIEMKLYSGLSGSCTSEVSLCQLKTGEMTLQQIFIHDLLNCYLVKTCWLKGVGMYLKKIFGQYVHVWVLQMPHCASWVTISSALQLPLHWIADNTFCSTAQSLEKIQKIAVMVLCCGENEQAEEDALSLSENWTMIMIWLKTEVWSHSWNNGYRSFI